MSRTGGREACKAGASISWRRSLRRRRQSKAWGEARLCERNPRNAIRTRFKPAIAGDRTIAAKCQQFCSAAEIPDCRPFHGLKIYCLKVPGVSLAKPRFTPGFMPAPASQAKSDFSFRACVSVLLLALHSLLSLKIFPIQDLSFLTFSKSL